MSELATFGELEKGLALLPYRIVVDVGIFFFLFWFIQDKIFTLV